MLYDLMLYQGFSFMIFKYDPDFLNTLKSTQHVFTWDLFSSSSKRSLKQSHAFISQVFEPETLLSLSEAIQLQNFPSLSMQEPRSSVDHEPRKN